MKLVACLAAVTAGCLSVQDSASLANTSTIQAGITVSANGTGSVSVGASLQSAASAGTFIQLSSGDSLTASTGAQSQPMVPIPIMGIPSYVASFTGTDAADTPYKVALTRSSGGSAPSSTCSLPPPFDVTLATTATSFSRANDPIQFMVTNTGGADDMAVSVTGSCIRPQVFGIGNGPTPRIVQGSIQSMLGAPTDSTCVMTLALQRTRQGTTDPAFSSASTMQCIQARALSVTSTP